MSSFTQEMNMKKLLLIAAALTLSTPMIAHAENNDQGGYNHQNGDERHDDRHDDRHDENNAGDQNGKDHHKNEGKHHKHGEEHRDDNSNN
ncbi:hypothetical protein AAJCM20276_34490 [Acetobacter aceti]|uniref:Pentapeptide MXKDX repeat protein n=2 Tax=Acetobacter aceti TaxID=435 RepID=A0A6S6PQD8_ACEAC|nr:hypothetical protein AAJCM20276_34490 [Acetobacter aceti]